MVASFLGLIGMDEEDEQKKQYIGYAMDGARRMSVRIDALLRYARAGRAALDVRTVSLQRIVDTVAHDLQVACREAGAVIDATDLPDIHADAGSLEHVLQNLIANALKFRAPDRTPRIQVSATADGSGWEIAVRDNGIGFDPKYAERIFGVFARLHGQGEFEGSGIGLAVCHRVVERHHGRIWAEGVPGQGAIFRFSLPGAPTA